jgi:subtilisin family serine protease
MALQAFNSGGVALTADIAAAITYAARNGAKAANYSFSAAGGSDTERRAVAYAARRGVVQVAAAGNTGEEPNANDRNVGYPARLDKVIAVSATDRSDGLASYSSRGPAVDVAAPGSAILSTIPGQALYLRLDGTSMAAPHVAGLAALLRSQGFGAGATRDRIQNGAEDLGPAGQDPKFGHGRINMRRSLD